MHNTVNSLNLDEDHNIDELSEGEPQSFKIPDDEIDVVGLLNFNYKSRYISKRFRTHTCAFSKKQCSTKHKNKIKIENGK